jgi:hypothetical protein
MSEKDMERVRDEIENGPKEPRSTITIFWADGRVEMMTVEEWRKRNDL